LQNYLCIIVNEIEEMFNKEMLVYEKLEL